eukprot:4696504-Pyramimonas_sp.AAC.1
MLPYTPPARPKQLASGVALLPSTSAHSQPEQLGQHRAPKMHSNTRSPIARNPSTSANGHRARAALR